MSGYSPSLKYLVQGQTDFVSDPHFNSASL